MNVGISRLIGGMFGLCAFSVAIISGLAAQNPAGRTITTALIAMIVCNLIGLGFGIIAERLVTDHVGKVTASRPTGDPAAPAIVTHNRARRP